MKNTLTCCRNRPRYTVTPVTPILTLFYKIKKLRAHFLKIKNMYF